MLNNNQAWTANSVLKIIGFPKDHKTAEIFRCHDPKAYPNPPFPKYKTNIPCHVTTISSDSNFTWFDET